MEIAVGGWSMVFGGFWLVLKGDAIKIRQAFAVFSHFMWLRVVYFF
jgi:hypothetical protein